MRTHPLVLTRVNATTGKRTSVRAIASDMTESVFVSSTCFTTQQLDVLPSSRFILDAREREASRKGQTGSGNQQALAHTPLPVNRAVSIHEGRRAETQSKR